MPSLHKVQNSRKREVFPASHHRWLADREGKFESLREEFEVWKEAAEMNMELFRRYVYDNPDATDTDYRQHRQRVTGMICEGDRLYSKFTDYRAENEVTQELAEIDELIAKYSAIFCDWHAPVGWKDAVPESFKKGMEEIAEGKVVDMEKALSEKP